MIKWIRTSRLSIKKCLFEPYLGLAGWKLWKRALSMGTPTPSRRRYPALEAVQGQRMFFLVNSHRYAISKRWHLWWHHPGVELRANPRSLK